MARPPTTLRPPPKRALPQTERPPLTVSRAELLTDGTDREFRELVHAFFACQGRHETLRDGHAAHVGLPGIQYTILIAIRHLEAEGDLSAKQLTDHLHCSSAFVAMETGKLVRAGLIVKERDPHDARRICLRTTPLTRVKLATLAPVQRRVNDLEFAGLTRSDFKNLARIINSLITNCDAAIALQRHIEPGGSRDLEQNAA